MHILVTWLQKVIPQIHLWGKTISTPMYTKCWFHLAILLYEVINIAVQRGQGCGLIHPQKSDSLSETCQYVCVDDHAGGSQVMKLMSHQSCCLPTFHRRRCLLCRRGCSWKFHWKELVVIQGLDNTWNCATQNVCEPTLWIQQPTQCHIASSHWDIGNLCPVCWNNQLTEC